MKKRVIVCGPRDFNNKDLVFSTLSMIYVNQDIEIVEGGALGVDRFAREWAIMMKQPYKTFDANWTLYGNSAGPIRNAEMAEYGTECLSFWGGKVKKSGTHDMIVQAVESGLNVMIISINLTNING